MWSRRIEPQPGQTNVLDIVITSGCLSDVRDWWSGWSGVSIMSTGRHFGVGTLNGKACVSAFYINLDIFEILINFWNLICFSFTHFHHYTIFSIYFVCTMGSLKDNLKPWSHIFIHTAWHWRHFFTQAFTLYYIRKTCLNADSDSIIEFSL